MSSEFFSGSELIVFDPCSALYFLLSFTGLWAAKEPAQPDPQVANV